MYTKGLANLVLIYGQTPSTIYIEGINQKTIRQVRGICRKTGQFMLK